MNDIIAERMYPTPWANSPLLPLLLLSLATQRQSPRTVDSFHAEYDYIIVGAGAGGSVVANRLSEEPCINILLIEAGNAPPLLTDVPAVLNPFLGTELDWKYRTEPQKYAGDGLINRQVPWPSGKTLGGSTVVNGNTYIRGNRQDFDAWERAGATGWSYEDVLPYFKKMEDNIDPEFLKSGYRGIDGPVTVHKPRYQSELKDAIDETIYEMGYKKNDPNGPQQTGFPEIQGNLRKSQRCSTAKAYLVPAENRTNLHILAGAFVKEIVLRNRRAVGVRFDYDGLEFEVKARREVILSAGTVNSAKLLLLSGIGPKEQLQEFGIPVVADLPVGLNLHDHCGTFMMYTLSDAIPPFTEKLEDPHNIKAYINQRSGPLASTVGISNFILMSNKRYTGLEDVPFHELYFQEDDATAYRTTYGIRSDVYESVFGPYENSTIYNCMSVILRPKSRGYVALKSSDPYDPPLINPNYFQNPLDLKETVEGMKACDKIANSKPMKRIGSMPFDTLYPGCTHVANDKDSYFACMARSVVISYYHPVGTVKMGKPSDPSTVVDPQLRVKGVIGLRVVDASVMPYITSGNTMVPTIMIGEKASDIIKETIDCYSHLDKEQQQNDEY